MEYEIAPIRQKYRGMERVLDITDILNSQNKASHDIILENYFSYLEYSVMETNHSIEKLIAYFKEFIKYDVVCEIIVYDITRIDKVDGYSLELLGIDIVHDMCESLISDEVNPKIIHLLNENGLCRTIDDVKRIIPYQEHGEAEWQPCYVYKVILKNDLK